MDKREGKIKPHLKRWSTKNCPAWKNVPGSHIVAKHRESNSLRARHIFIWSSSKLFVSLFGIIFLNRQTKPLMSRRLPFCSGGYWNIDLSSSNWEKLLLYPPVFIFTKKHCVDEFPLLTTDLWDRSLFFPLQKEVTLGSRGIFLIPDSSRQTVTTRGKARREKK